MKILVSACLLGENCKYSGGNNYNQAVCDFARGHQVVPVCPEVLGGLPTPRCPAEIVQGVVTNKEGINVDREFRAGAAKALAIAKENGVELAILQSRSPSCGVKEIYDGTFSGTKIPGQGVFAKMLMDEGVESYTEQFVPRWKEANCAVAGPYWIDTTFANKGIGVRSICKTLDIALADVMAFGDNYNDVSMLDIVGVPYIMDGAAAPLREKYPNHTPCPEDVLREFLKQN